LEPARRDFIQPSSAAFYNRRQHIRHLTRARRRGCHHQRYPHNPQEHGAGAKVFLRHNWRIFMTSRPNEAAIDEIVASCNGDMRGALQALLLVNEHLEAELAQLYAAVIHGPFGRDVLH
jgi:hypothetical protein